MVYFDENKVPGTLMFERGLMKTIAQGKEWVGGNRPNGVFDSVPESTEIHGLACSARTDVILINGEPAACRKTFFKFRKHDESFCCKLPSSDNGNDES